MFVCFPQNFEKMISIGLRCQSTKSELSIDVLNIYWSLQSFVVRQRQSIFVKSVKKCNPSALLNFVSLHTNTKLFCSKYNNHTKGSIQMMKSLIKFWLLQITLEFHISKTLRFRAHCCKMYGSSQKTQKKKCYMTLARKVVLVPKKV